MIDSETQKVVDKQFKLRAPGRARARVRRLEREFSCEPVGAQDPRHLPELLRQRVVRPVS